MTPANRFKLLRVDRLDEVFRFQISVEPSSQNESVGVPASALQRSTILKLADLLREAHWVADLVCLTFRFLAGSVLPRNRNLAVIEGSGSGGDGFRRNPGTWR